MGINYVKTIGFLCLLILSSCSLQKRLYNKGFYVSKHHSNIQTEAKPDAAISPFEGGLRGMLTTKEKEATTLLLTNSTTNNSTFSILYSKLYTDGCDTIFLRNGVQLLVKVTEVNPEQIVYTYCNAPNENRRTINKTNINYVMYANGVKETYSEVQQNNTQIQYSSGNDNYKNHTARNLAIIGLIFLIIGIILCLLLFIPSLWISAGGCIGIAFDLVFAVIFILTGIILLVISLINFFVNK